MPTFSSQSAESALLAMWIFSLVSSSEIAESDIIKQLTYICLPEAQAYHSHSLISLIVTGLL